MTADTFSIITYQITDAGKAEAIDKTFTIRKDASQAAFTVDGQAKTVAAATADGQTYYRLRDVAAALNGTAKQFDVGYNKGVVLTTNKAYSGKGLSPYATAAGTAASLTVTVDGKAVETAVVRVAGNYYVPAAFLKTLGVAAVSNGARLAVTTK